VRYQQPFERVCRIGKPALPYDPRCALERVRGAQEPGDQLRVRTPFQVQYALTDLVDELARLDPEVPQRILGHG
jgi:hypothetical protein